MATSSEKKNEARLKREQAQAASQAAAARNKRLQILGAVVFVAIAAVVLVIAFTSGSKKNVDTKSDTVLGVSETKTLFSGIEQNGLALGDPKAPVTIIEFVDVQCPFCREHELDQQPTVIKNLVRTGKAKVRLAPIALSFMGEDSEAGRTVLMRLAAKNKGWNFANLFYFNQGQEQTGYVTDKFLTKLATAAGGTAADATPRTASGEIATKLKEIDQLSTDLGVTGTPSFAIGKTGTEPKDYKLLELTGTDTAGQLATETAKLSGDASATTPAS